MEQDLARKVREIYSEEQVKQGEALAKHTTFRIGGPADFFVCPKNIEEIKKTLLLCKEENLPYYILGNGSNILAGDQGFRGMIIQIGSKMSDCTWEKQEDGSSIAVVGAGMLLSKFSKEAASQSLTGLEFAGGIPGTVGGAVTMNAGAYGGEIKDCIVDATVITKDGEVKILSRDELELGYRSSVIQKEEYIVVEAKFRLQAGEQTEILATMDDLLKKRREKQPLEYPSAGSTFKRPEGYFAGKLIQDADLRGYRVGDIMVSEKHCGFVVNVGQGTAKDVHQLIEDVQNIVYEKFQVRLEPEVRFLGE